jgi:hypothetical protein
MARSADTMERWFDAFNAHDIEALLELAHPEIEIVPLTDAVSSLPGTSYHGHEGLRSLTAAGFERWTHLQMLPGIMEWDGDSVIVPITFVLDDGGAPASTRGGATVFRGTDV